MGKRINVSQILEEIADHSAEDRLSQLLEVADELTTSLNSVKRELNILEGRAMAGEQASPQKWAKLRSAQRTIGQKLQKINRAIAEVRQELAVPPLSDFFVQVALKRLPPEEYDYISFEATNLRDLARYEARNRPVCV